MWNDRYVPQAGTRSLSWAQWISRAKSPCHGHIVSVFSHDHFVDNVTRVVILFHCGPCDCFVDSVTCVVVLLTLWPVWLFCLQCDMCGCFVYTVTRVSVLFTVWPVLLFCSQSGLCDCFVYSVTCVIVLLTLWPVWLFCLQCGLCDCFVYSVACVVVLFDMRGCLAYTVTRVTVLYSVTCAIILFTLWPVWLFCLQCDLCGCCLSMICVFVLFTVWPVWLFNLHCDLCDCFVYSVGEWGSELREAGWKHEWSHKSEVAITKLFICTPTNQETVSVGKYASKQNI